MMFNRFKLAYLLLFALIAALVVGLTHPSSPALATNNCDSAYPGVCIAPPPPDLDCKDISYRNFKVVAPDSHGFDRDKDGIGCEQ
jgi:micrococcal nuclease